MNTECDYSAAFIILKTEGDLTGQGMTFTCVIRSSRARVRAAPPHPFHSVGPGLTTARSLPCLLSSIGRGNEIVSPASCP